MHSTWSSSALGRRFAQIGLVLAAGVFVASTALAQAPAAAPQKRVFSSDAGLLFNTVKPDKTADFEMIMAKLKEALQKSDKPERKQQAAGWKVFKSVEAGPQGNVLYIFVIDPAVKDADYTVSMILSEAFPTEVQELFKVYAGSLATGQNLVNLQMMQNYSK